ncbi:hypothetical protein [Elioraea sp.]|uniref:hypothetical protein n=1 Tax=Elioraea sp. TaxID=2185103 RepID=UPI0025C2E1F2|nr:hypothetical protein [Elioraea sp.]
MVRSACWLKQAIRRASASTLAAPNDRYPNDAKTAQAIAGMWTRIGLPTAVEMAMEDVALSPIMQLVNAWATKRTLVYEPRMDERTLAMSVRPAP